MKVAPQGAAGCLCGHELAFKEAAGPEAPGPSVGTPRVAKSQFSVITIPQPSPLDQLGTLHTQEGFTIYPHFVFSFAKFLS